MHEETGAEPEAVILGADLDGKKGRLVATARRRTRLRLALLWCSRRPRITGRELERLVGHCIFVLLTYRASLSVLRHVYDFIRDSYDRPQRLWISVAEECRHLAGFMPLVCADLRLKWSGFLSLTDGP